MLRFKTHEKAVEEYPGSVERCPQQKDLDGLRSYRESIEHSKSLSMDQAAIEKQSRMR